MKNPTVAPIARMIAKPWIMLVFSPLMIPVVRKAERVITPGIDRSMEPLPDVITSIWPMAGTIRNEAEVVMLMRLSTLRLPEIIPMVIHSSIDAMQAHSQEL